MADFKDNIPREQALTPSGYYVVMRENIGEPGWAVWVYDFATWNHRVRQFSDEASARGHFTQWLI